MRQHAGGDAGPDTPSDVLMNDAILQEISDFCR